MTYLIQHSFYYILLSKMRIFISWNDESGVKRTSRLTLSACKTTNNLISSICKTAGINKKHTIIRLKYQPFNLRVIEDWPINYYPIKNGSIFHIELIQQQQVSRLPEIRESSYQYLTERSSIDRVSFLSDKNQREDIYLEECLKRILEQIKKGDLFQVATILKEEPQAQQQEQVTKIMEKKNSFLVNEMGDQGLNALHCAIKCQNVEIVSFLLIKGSNPSLVTHDEFTPLQLAVQTQSAEIIRILLQQKLTDINHVNRWGTALHVAAAKQMDKSVQILLQHDADTQIINLQGLRPIDVSVNRNISELLLKKRKISKNSPTISKGKIFQVSSSLYRLKQKILFINPFKKIIYFENMNKIVEFRSELQKILKVERITEKSWLMNKQLNYFKIIFRDENESSMIFALKHEKTYEKWLSNIHFAVECVENAQLFRPIALKDQVVEMISDDKNEIILHKRKIEQPVSRHFKNESILNLPFQAEQNKMQMMLSTPVRGSIPFNELEYSRENMSFQQSEIGIGSIIKEFSTIKSSEEQYPEVVEVTTTQISPYDESYAKSLINTQQGSTKSRFRKQSEKIQIVSDFKHEEKVTISYKDFQLIKMIGSGSFGQVYFSRYLKTNKIYALKVLNKRRLIAKKQLKYAISEANIMKKLDSPFVITLHYAFETPLNLYMAIDHCSNGDLSEIIVVRQKLRESTACFVIAQVILAIEHLHNNNILYRDLKSQNILVTSDGYIKLIDFGLSKENNFSMSFCGSPAYLSPEMLDKKGVGFESDIYGIGAVLYEMVVGQPPFFDDNMDVMFNNIKSGKLRFPSNLSIQIKSLIGKLLERDVTKRLGRKDINDIKRHEFFKKLSWKHLQNKKIKAPDELFINEQDDEQFEPVALDEKRDTIDIEDYDYGQTSSNLMNKVNNFTFARDPDSTKDQLATKKLF